MEDNNEAIEHLHAAIQLIGVAAFAIGRAESQIRFGAMSVPREKWGTRRANGDV